MASGVSPPIRDPSANRDRRLITPWEIRPAEERGLLNPGFCSCLLWQAAIGYLSVSSSPLSFDISFLVLPLVLDRETREALPKKINSSLAVWIADKPLSRSRIVDRARRLVPFTKEAMMFGGVHGLFVMTETQIRRRYKLEKTHCERVKTID